MYKFEQFETYVDYGGGGGPHKSSWYLTKIISASGHTVDFIYASLSAYIHSVGSYFESIPGANLAGSTSGAVAPSPFSYYSAANPGKWYTNLYISKINFDNGEMQFNYLQGRLDVENDVQLRNIQIYSKKTGENNRLIKTWDFGYSYFDGTQPGGGINFNATGVALTKRLKLISLQESSSSSSNPPYKFFYNNENDFPSSLPGKLSFSRDHWGYYNGKPNTSLIPSFSSESRLDPVTFYVGLMGNERNPDPQYNQLFSLNKIVYPTGGFTQFQYETHDFDETNSIINDHGYFANQTSLVPKPITATIYPNNVAGTYTTDIDFTDMYTDNSTAGQTVTLKINFIISSLPYTSVGILGNVTYTFQPVIGFDNNISSSLMTNVNSSPPNPVLIPARDFNNPNQTISTITLTNPYGMTPGKYRFIVNIPSGTQIYTIGIGGSYYVSETVSMATPSLNNGSEIIQNSSYGGGLRIKRITDYSDASAIPKIRRYNYHYIGTDGKTYSYGRRMSKPNYSYFSELSGISNPGHPPDIPDIIATSNVLIRESDSNIPLNGSAGGSSVGYDKVEEFLGENGENGKTLYEYQNQPDVIFNYTQFEQVLSQITGVPRKPPFGGSVSIAGNGNLSKQTEFVKSGTTYHKLKEVINNYQDLIIPAANAAVLGIEKRANAGSNPFVAQNCYIINYVYPAITENRNVLVSTSTNMYNGINDVTPQSTILNEYTYNTTTHLQMTSKSEYRSNGDKITTNYTYPLDYADAQSDAAILLMKGSAYMHALPLTQQNVLTKGTAQYVTSGTITKYQILNSKIFAKEKAVFENTQPVAIASVPSYNPASTAYPAAYVPRLFYDNYDASGNITQLHKSGDVSMTYIWDYFANYPIAEVTNATNSSVAYTSFEADGTGNWNTYTGTITTVTTLPLPPTGNKYYNLTTTNTLSKTGLTTGNIYIISYWSKNASAYTVNGGTGTYKTGRSISGWTYYEHKITASAPTLTITGNGAIDEVRLYPANAQMTTYTYEPLIGITSQCDVNNRIIYYEYDAFSRLKLIRDQDNNIVKRFDYQYQQQP